MATLTIPNSFVAGTPALASEVNANFTAIENWSLGQIGPDNFSSGWAQNISFILPTGNAIVIQNNGNDESIKITQGALLGASKASILITDNQTQTAAGAAELKMVLASGATIPALHITHGATDTFKLTKDYLRLEALLKPPVRTTLQRNAISSPEEGSIIYNSTNQELNVKQNLSWAPVGCPVGSVQMFAGSAAPQGWLLCNGDTIPNGSGTVQTITADYSALYAVVGSSYGGAGKLPDCRGIFVRGVGSQTIGAETYTGTLGTYQNDATAKNGLSASDSGHTHNYSVYALTDRCDNADESRTMNGSTTTWTTSTGYANITVSSTDTETRPANIALNYIIKY